MKNINSGREEEKGSTKIKAFVQKWLSMYVDEKKLSSKTAEDFVSKLGKGAISFLSAAIFASAMSYGGTMPFGLALLCGSEKRTVFILLGALVGALTAEKSGIYIVASMLIFTLRLLVGYVLEGKKKGIFTEPKAIRMAIGAAGGFVTGIYRIFNGGFKEAQLYEAFFLIIGIPVISYIFSERISKAHSIKGMKEISSVLMYTVLILGLKEISFFGFSLALAISAFLTLGTSLFGGCLRGTLVGMVGGIAIGGMEYAVMLGVMGAVGGYLKKKSEVVAVGVGCVSGALGAVMFGGNIVLCVPSLLWGGALCLPTAKAGILNKLSVLEGRSEMSEKAGNAVMLVTKRDEEMRTKLNSLSEAMTSLSSVFYALSNRLSSPGAYKVRELCEGSFKKYCQKCSKNIQCWGRDHERTADILNKLAVSVTKHGTADSSYIPVDFLSSCSHIMEILSEVNLTHARLLENAARQNKTEIFALDYEAMAKLLTEASEENLEEYSLDSRLSERARRSAVNMGMGFHSIAVYGKRRKTVVAGGVELERVHIASSEMRAALSDAVGVKLSVPEFKLDDGYITMTATSERTVSVESSGASLKKKDEQVNGDSIITFENREDRFYALISDGMGSGHEASMTSRMTGIFLEKLLSAGNRKNTVLKMLNNFIRNKNLECFATVDLLELDLLSGEGSFIKSGASASYILRDGKLFKIASKSLPIGITREIASEEIKFEVKDNDLIIMLSDGICQSCDDTAWLLSMLSEDIDVSAPLQSISKSILNKAKEKNGRCDDMSVLAVRVEMT